MMYSHKLLVAGSMMIGLLTPLGAAAYVTPEQVLLQDAFINNFTPPPSTRSTDDRVADQQETSAERREREQAEYFAAQRGDSDDEDLRGAAPDDSNEDPELTDVLSSLQESIDNLNDEKSLRDQRILDRIERQQELQALAALGLRSGAPLDAGKGGDGKGCDYVTGKGECVINSGAPLNESGPATYALFALGLAAVSWTLWKMGKSDGAYVEIK